MVASGLRGSDRTLRLPRRRRGTDPARTTSRTPRRFPGRPGPRRPRTIPGAGCTPARGTPRPARGTGSAGSRCGRCRRGRCPRRPRARTRGGRARPRASRDTERLGVRLPASRPQARPVRGRVLGVGAHPLGHRGEEPGEQRVGRRVEAEARGARRERVEVLGPTDGPAVDRLDVDEARLAQALQVEAHGVGVQAERVGEVLGGERRRRCGQLAVHREARLVAQGLQDLELHALTVPSPRAYFQDVGCFYSPHGH